MTSIVAFQMLVSKSPAPLRAKPGFLQGRRASLTCRLLFGRCLWPFLSGPFKRRLAVTTVSERAREATSGQNGAREAAKFMAEQFPESPRS